MLAVITGGSGAIGSMCAYEAAKRGYDVVFTYNNNEKAADSVIEMLGGFDVKIEAVRADISCKEDIERLAERAKALGGADILVNNSGIADIRAFADTDNELTSKMLSVNLEGHINLTRKILSQMFSKGRGSIVNISSVWGIRGASCEVLYSAAKAGLVGFTKSLAKELAPSSITVNCVAPGCIHSKMTEHLDKDILTELIPMQRIGSGLDVAKAVFFLATNDYITGQVLAVDGGMSI